MPINSKKYYDIIVIGAGHAGIEAAWTSARMGCSVGIVTMDLDAIGRMSCNPAIGGSAKGHLVKEIDALGGVMGRIADDTGIQFRMLNKSKGPAIWSPRCQSDRDLYSKVAKEYILSCENIELIQGTIDELILESKSALSESSELDKRIAGVITSSGDKIKCKSVIITSGTFLNAVMHTGHDQTEGGRFGEKSSKGLSNFLLNQGFITGRLKTGTPPRLAMDTIDFNQTEEQAGDSNPTPFSVYSNGNFPRLKQISCFLTYTNKNTHEILKTGFDDSPMFTGRITGIGPRYCPSIEDKIYRFADKKRHQIFLEPEGLNTNIAYMNGFSSSLPAEIQYQAMKTIPGLHNVKMFRAGYAVEYDFLPTQQTKLTLETKLIEGLYVAGQINGTSGYEEAAAQGLIAGINSALKIQNKDPFILKRSEAYIGVLIDDLINKCPEEPYRIFTSCAEYRLILRQDNADLRLMKYGNRFGLIPDDMYSRVVNKEQLIKESIKYFKSTFISPKDINAYLAGLNTGLPGQEGTPERIAELKQSDSLSQIIKRNEIKLGDLLNIEYFNESGLADNLKQNSEAVNQVEIELKYEGYITRQNIQTNDFEQNETAEIPAELDFNKIKSLSTEGREKLNKVRPRSLGQASRIAGVSPSDVSILSVYMKG
jgi:tRNA uridine 5-carboxymethylaminomethyl modification enzyme